MTPLHNLVPTSSQPRPGRGDDLPGATSSLVPHPVGDEVALRRPGHPTQTAPARPTHRDEQDDHLFHYYAGVDTPLCAKTGDTDPEQTWGHYLTGTPDLVDCPRCLEWLHA